jgi:hypothetical protein
LTRRSLKRRRKMDKPFLIINQIVCHQLELFRSKMPRLCLQTAWKRRSMTQRSLRSNNHQVSNSEMMLREKIQMRETGRTISGTAMRRSRRLVMRSRWQSNKRLNLRDRPRRTRRRRCHRNLSSFLFLHLNRRDRSFKSLHLSSHRARRREQGRVRLLPRTIQAEAEVVC